jgi:predicted component of type VI protein secretion system
METFKSNQDLYRYLDSAIGEMRGLGLHLEAQRLHVLLHERVWTTTSELFDELGSALLAILAVPSLPMPIHQKLERCAVAVDAAPPETRRRWKAE